MPKKTKDTQKENVAAISSAPEVKPEKTKSRSVKRKPSAKSPRKSAAPGEKKASNASQKETRLEPSLDEIRVRAYFLSERRIKLSLPADARADWLEAKRQLLEEAERPSL